MPRDPMASPTKSASRTAVCYGQVIEFIQGKYPYCDHLGCETLTKPIDKLYLASYTHAPNSSTPFPWPDLDTKSPVKRSAHKSSRSVPVAQPKTTSRPPIIYFSVDNTLLYNAFHADFGPLHIGHLYRFAITLHEVLSEHPDSAIVFWSYADSRRES